MLNVPKVRIVNQRGFTMIELIVVMVIVAVLAALAYPSYRQYVIQARRADGQTALLETQKQLQSYYQRCGTYPATLGPGGNPPPCTTGLGLMIPVISQGGNYTVTYAPAPFTDPITGILNPLATYTLTAAPTATYRQIDDTACGSLTLTDSGQRGRSGTAPLDRCWRQ